jgi:hypothetical protein
LICGPVDPKNNFEMGPGQPGLFVLPHSSMARRILQTFVPPKIAFRGRRQIVPRNFPNFARRRFRRISHHCVIEAINSQRFA